VEKNHQLKILTLCCVLILAGLIAIQYYLVSNTYNLKKNEYVKEVKDSVYVLVNSAEIDSIELSFQDIVKDLKIQQLKDSITAEEFKIYIKQKADSLLRLTNAFMESHRKDYPILENINLRGQFSKIYFENDTIRDSILTLSQPALIYLGKQLESQETFRISSGAFLNNSDWISDDYSAPDREKFNIKIYHEIDFDISNWQFKILSRMAWMLILAVFLILSVVALFFWMYRAIIKQKKIAQIKTDFANNITHELKTPLTSLNLIVKSFQNEQLMQNPEMMKSLIQSMNRQNNRIQQIFDRILETTIDHQKVNLEEVEMIQFLKEFVQDYQSSSHLIKLDLDPNELILTTDSYQLGRVLQNVLQNAEKYSPEGSEILIKSYLNNSEYIMEIQDSGVGIPSSEQGRIFDKFYRITKGNLHDVKGLGLGLYLSKQIMESLKGSISVESQVDKGSTFTLRIPVERR
jgi:two-component system phosphate regulon sensor histidine kinase PhoR